MRTGARGLRGVLMRRMGGERYLQPRRRHGARISCSCTLAVCHPSSRPHCTAAAVPPAPHSPIIRLHDARTTARRCRNRAELETNYHHFTARSSCRSRSWSNVNRRHHNSAPSVNPNCRMSIPLKKSVPWAVIVLVLRPRPRFCRGFRKRGRGRRRERGAEATFSAESNVETRPSRPPCRKIHSRRLTPMPRDYIHRCRR